MKKLLLLLTLLVPFALPMRAFGAITYVGVGTPTFDADGGNTSMTANNPAGLATGDVKITYVAHGDTGGSVVSLSGWTELYSDVGTSGGHLAVFCQVHSGEASPTVTFSGLEANDGKIVQMAAWRGVTGCTPGASGTVSINAGSQDVGPISGITAPANSIVLVLGQKRSSVSTAAPSNYATLTGESLTWVKIAENTDTVASADSVWNYAIVGGSSTAIAAKTFDGVGTSISGKGVMFALDEAAAGGGTPTGILRRRS